VKARGRSERVWGKLGLVKIETNSSKKGRKASVENKGRAVMILSEEKIPTSCTSAERKTKDGIEGKKNCSWKGQFRIKEGRVLDGGGLGAHRGRQKKNLEY